MLIEVGGWRLLTDPTFDPPGRRYHFGWGTVVAQARRARPWPRPTFGRSTRCCSPTITTATTSTTPGARCSRRPASSSRPRSGAKRLGGGARGLEPWAARRGSRRPTGRRIEVTATPCRHGPPLSHPIVGDVIGFALRWDGQEHGVLWISGDTVLYDGVRQVADRLRGRHRAAAPRRRALPGHRAAALHDDRPRRRRAVRLDAAAHRDPDPLRGLEALPGGPGGHRARARRPRPRTSRRASAGCPSGTASTWRREPIARERIASDCAESPCKSRSARTYACWEWFVLHSIPALERGR